MTKQPTRRLLVLFPAFQPIKYSDLGWPNERKRPNFWRFHAHELRCWEHMGKNYCKTKNALWRYCFHNLYLSSCRMLGFPVGKKKENKKTKKKQRILPSPTSLDEMQMKNCKTVLPFLLTPANLVSTSIPQVLRGTFLLTRSTLSAMFQID